MGHFFKTQTNQKKRKNFYSGEKVNFSFVQILNFVRRLSCLFAVLFACLSFRIV